MILTIAKDILHGLQYLHNHDLAHRDLKVCTLAAKPIMLPTIAVRSRLHCCCWQQTFTRIWHPNSLLCCVSDRSGETGCQNALCPCTG